MRWFLSLILAASIGVVEAATVEINVNAAHVADATAICNIVEVTYGKPDATMQQCAQLMFNEVLRKYKRAAERKAATATASATIAAAMEVFDAVDIDPLPDAFCGDSIISPAYNEECDDGNVEDGDGCSSTCLTE